jgi:hypothetical protein
MAAIRRALLPGAAPPDEGPVDLGALRRDLVAAWRERQGCRYLGLGGDLPGLIGRARAATATLTGHERDVAYGLLADVLYLTARLSLIVGDQESATGATLAGIAAAEQAGDPLILAVGSYRYCNPLLRSGRPDDARDICTAAALPMERQVTGGDKAAASVYGGLHLMAAVASARLLDRPAAQDHLAEAQRAADLFDGEQRNDHWLAFGPTNVAVHRVSVAVELGEFGEALRRAEDVDVTRFPPEMTERRSRVLVDVARSYMAERKDEAAMASLLQADAIAPEEIRYQVVARDMVRAVLRRRRTPVPGTVQLAKRMGITAP